MSATRQAEDCLSPLGPTDLGRLFFAVILHLGRVATPRDEWPTAPSFDPGFGYQGAGACGPEEARAQRREGGLSSRFESGRSGIAAVGYDETGGTSYGLYQISSRKGTMGRFLDYLDPRAPDWAARLRGCGEADTGGREGRMPEEWRRIAGEDPGRFQALQHAFVKEVHYADALREVQERTGLDIGGRSVALQEVLWSTAVQHGAGGAASVFGRAVEALGARGEGFSEGELIQAVYESRARQFETSRPEVRAAVLKRLDEEQGLALAMLKEETSGFERA